MSEDGKRTVGSDGVQDFNKLEITKDEITLTIQYDGTINESISAPKEPDLYVKFEDHRTGKGFDQKLYLLEFMLMLRQYIMNVKEVESCLMCKYMRLQPWEGPGLEGVGLMSYPEWPHCSLKNLDPIPPELMNEFKVPEWCPAPNPKDRIDPLKAMGLDIPQEDENSCGGCGGACGCGSNSGRTVH